MDQEYAKELKMSYRELCSYLQSKYGMSDYDYFPNKECKTKNRKVSRTAEGLFCHHTFEDRYDNLSIPQQARYYPYDAQKKENLAYCNYLEHLILHLKINANARSEFKYVFDINHFFNSLGFFWIINEINDLYRNNGSSQEWRNNCYLAIKDSFEDYVSILRGVLCFIEDGFDGEKKTEIKEGNQFVFEFHDTTVEPNKEALRGYQHTHTKIGVTVKKIIKVKGEEVAVLQAERPLTKEELFALGITRIQKGFMGPVKGDASLFAYKRKNLEDEYDFELGQVGTRRTFSTLSDFSVWEEMEERLMPPYADTDKDVSIWIRQASDF